MTSRRVNPLPPFRQTDSASTRGGNNAEQIDWLAYLPPFRLTAAPRPRVAWDQSAVLSPFNPQQSAGGSHTLPRLWSQVERPPTATTNEPASKSPTPTDSSNDAAPDDRLALSDAETARVYGDGSSAEGDLAAQAAYLSSQFKEDPAQVHRIPGAQWTALMRSYGTAGRTAESDMDGPAEFIDVTDHDGAAVSEGAGPCLVVLMKAEVDDNGRRRTLLGSVHKSAPDRGPATGMTPGDVQDDVLQRLDEGLRRMHAGTVISRELHLVGGATTSVESATALAHTAELLGLDVKTCILPTNRAGQTSHVLLNRDGLHLTTTQTSRDDAPSPSAMHWLGPAQQIHPDVTGTAE